MEKTLSQSIWKVIGQHRNVLTLALFGLTISNALLVVNPLLFREAILILSQSTEDSHSWLHNYLTSTLGGYAQSIWVWIILLLVIAAVSSILKYYTRLEFIAVSRQAEQTLRSELFEQIQNQSMEFFDRHGTGELLSRLTNDVSVYRDVLGPGVLFPAYFFTMLVPGMWGLFSISPQLAWMSILPLLSVPIVYYFFHVPIYKASKELQEALAEMSNTVQENYAGIRMIKAYAVEKSSFEYFKKQCRQFIQLSVRMDVLEGMLYPLLFMLNKLITLELVIFASLIIFKAWGSLSPADFISFMWIQSYIYFPILMLGWLVPIYQQGLAAYDRIYDIYQEPIAVVDHTISQYPLKINSKADIEFKNLSFTYPINSTPTFKGLNLTIKGGTFVGLTGPIGSGKTTLFKLLNREYEIPDGMILIGGHDIHAYPLEAFRQEIVTVDQIPFLFSKTIRENVRFGDEEAPMEKVEWVAQQVDLHETVLEFPMQYDTLVGERGVTLSGGQKQRVAMARAFLVDRSIILLDDVFASVDSATEKRIFEAIKNTYQGKTVLLITHRASLLQQMNRVVYIKEGRVVEDGHPHELITRGGSYAALVELQRFTERRT